MKHFVTLIQNDSTAACFAYDSKQAAMGKFHAEMSYAMTAGVTTICSVMNANGGIVVTEKFTAPPEPADGGGEE